MAFVSASVDDDEEADNDDDDVEADEEFGDAIRRPPVIASGSDIISPKTTKFILSVSEFDIIILLLSHSSLSVQGAMSMSECSLCLFFYTHSLSRSCFTRRNEKRQIFNSRDEIICAATGGGAAQDFSNDCIGSGRGV